METDPHPITLTALPADGAAPGSLPLTPDAHGDYPFALECLPGADAIHLEIAIGGQPRLRAEVRAQGGEVVRCVLRLDAADQPGLEAGSHQILLLPVEPAYGPLPPIPPPREKSAWDICLVIDGTTRDAAAGAGPHAAEGTGAAREGGKPRPQSAMGDEPPAPPPSLNGFLLNQPRAWAAVVAPVVELVRLLGTQGPPDQGVRLAVIAFGDEPPAAGIYAADLIPAYRLRALPDERPAALLIPMAPPALAEALRRIPATPGGDFVDALADALAAAGRLQWGDERRRLLVVIGDSPGHATAHPAPVGADALPRRTDVDTEVARLHRDHQVEVLTLYHPPAAALVATLLDGQRALIDHAREQYRRLAADPRLAFTTADFDPGQALDTLLGRKTPLGRGPSWGRWRE